MTKKFLAVSALSLGMLLLQSPLAQAEVDGDQKCGADGNIMKYEEVYKRWSETFRKCKSQGQLSSESPADGDEKCGPANTILKYDRSYGKHGRWDETWRACKK